MATSTAGRWNTRDWETWYAECDWVESLNRYAPSVVAELGAAVFPLFQSESRQGDEPSGESRLREWFETHGLNVGFMREAVDATFDRWRGDPDSTQYTDEQLIQMGKQFGDWYADATRWYAEHPDPGPGQGPRAPPPLPPRRSIPAVRRTKMVTHCSPVATTPENAHRFRPALPTEWDPVRGEAFSEWEGRLKDYNEQLKDWAREHLNYAPEATPQKPEHYRWAVQRHVLLLGTPWIAEEEVKRQGLARQPPNTINEGVSRLLKRLGITPRRSPSMKASKITRAEMSRAEVGRSLGTKSQQAKTGTAPMHRSGARSRVDSSKSAEDEIERDNEEAPAGSRSKSKGAPHR